MNDKQGNMQDVFLNACRKEKQQVTVYLTSGVKLQGMISGFDNFCLVLRRASQTQLVYKHSIATIVPAKPLNTYNKGDDETSADTTEEGQPMITSEGSFQIA